MDTPNMDMERSLQELESIARALNDGKLGLEESFRLYRQAMDLYAACDRQLKQVAQQVRILEAEATLPKGDVEGAQTKGREDGNDPSRL